MSKIALIALWLGSACFVGFVSWCAIEFANGSNVLAPAPLVSVISASYLERWVDYYFAWKIPFDLLIAVLPAFGYLLLSGSVPRGRPRVPMTSVISFALLSIGTLVFFALYWKHGLRWQGLVYTAFLATLNALAIGGLMWLLVTARRRPSVAANWMFHTGFFLWLAWLSFPWLGELP